MKKNFLQLPQLVLECPPETNADNAPLLILGGRAPNAAWLKKIAAGRALWAVDRGVEVCQTLSAVPQYLVGDADSAQKSAWDRAEHDGAKVFRHNPEKDFTDTQLAFFYLREKNPSLAVITGCFGGRFDHAFSTFFSAAHEKFFCCLADEKEILFFLRGEESATVTLAQKPSAVSLLPFTEKTGGVSIDGMRWPLENAQLSQTMPYSVSNVPTGETFYVACETGILGVYFSF